MNKNRKLKTLGAVVLVLMLLLSGTFAFNSLNQIKRNQAKGRGSGLQDVTLIDEYTPTDDWQEDDSLTSRVAVMFNETNDATSKAIVVRVQLSEYLEYGEVSYKYTDKQYVTYSSQEQVDYAKNTVTLDPDPSVPAGTKVDPDAAIGGFVNFRCQEDYDASYFGQLGDSANYSSELRVDGIRYFPHNGKARKYIYVVAPTFDGNNLDANVQRDGQYGKPMPYEAIINENEGKDIQRLTDKEPLKLDYELRDKKTNQKDENMGKFYEKNFDKVYYSGAESLNDNDKYNLSQAYRQYVEQTWGSKIMTQAEYNTAFADNDKLSTWVYVDKAENGNVLDEPWFYWNRALLEGDTTADLLKSVKLIKGFEDAFFYSNNVELNATSFAGYKQDKDIARRAEWTFDIEKPLFGYDDADKDGTTGVTAPRRIKLDETFGKLAYKEPGKLGTTDGKLYFDLNNDPSVKAWADYKMQTSKDGSTPPSDPYIKLVADNGDVYELTNTSGSLGLKDNQKIVKAGTSDEYSVSAFDGNSGKITLVPETGPVVIVKLAR